MKSNLGKVRDIGVTEEHFKKKKKIAGEIFGAELDECFLED